MALNSATQPYAFDRLARFSWRLHSQLNINPNGIIICISLIYFYLKNTITSHDYTTVYFSI
ncbi:hypothetical protein T02_16121 [Trichinella nativa]|uniref:Uncharacterized protein n=3 Tax=Trichinella TaxID=6333 RepID=A0A0V1KY81_9BILA|nr:hypothetical protein T05_16052 [Trichinella murrelli]KRY50467.1 hypothetical protein T03_14472 [Trichinella britovi]KRZ52282.1 hypothetical protein T02_16121 [Trichinella nativa]